MTLYRALGINKSVSGAIPPKTLMGQIHSALQLEDHGKFDMHVPSKPQYQSSLDDNDEIKSGPASVKEIAKKMHEAVSLRKLFYRVKFYTEAQEKAAGFKANTKDKVILMHEREVKEQLKRITKNISTISNIDELKKISNALGITSVPFVLDVSKIDKTKMISHDSLIAMVTPIYESVKEITTGKIKSHKLSSEPDKDDIEHALNGIKKYKENEKTCKKINSNAMHTMAIQNDAKIAEHGWLRNEITISTFSKCADKLTINVNSNPDMDYDLPTTHKVDWVCRSICLNDFHTTIDTGFFPLPDKILHVFDVTQHIHYEQYVKDYDWLISAALTKVIKPKTREEAESEFFSPVKSADHMEVSPAPVPVSGGAGPASGGGGSVPASPGDTEELPDGGSGGAQ
jgi:hypothetical protein